VFGDQPFIPLQSWFEELAYPTVHLIRRRSGFKGKRQTFNVDRTFIYEEVS